MNICVYIECVGFKLIVITDFKALFCESPFPWFFFKFIVLGGVRRSLGLATSTKGGGEDCPRFRVSRGARHGAGQGTQGNPFS